MKGAPIKVPSKSVTSHRPPESFTIDFAALVTGFPSRPVDSIVASQLPTHFLSTSISEVELVELRAAFASGLDDEGAGFVDSWAQAKPPAFAASATKTIW